MALYPYAAATSAEAQLGKASTSRLTLGTRLAVVAVDDPETHLNELAEEYASPTSPEALATTVRASGDSTPCGRGRTGASITTPTGT